MADIFDEVGGDVFDAVGEDVFDRVEAESKPKQNLLKTLVQTIPGGGPVKAALSVASGVDVPATVKEAIASPVRTIESMAGGVGGLGRMAWEDASIGKIVTKHVDIPGIGLIAEHLIRKYGPEKALTFADKRMKSHAEMGKKLSDFFEEQANKGWEAPNPEITEARWRDRPVEKAVSTIMSGITSIGVAAGTTFATGSPQAGLSVLAATETGSMYSRLRKENVSPGVASKLAQMAGAWTYVTEKVPFEKLFKPGMKTIKGALKQSGWEGLQEVVEGMGHNWLEYFGYNYKKPQDIPTAVKASFDHTFEGFMDNLVGGVGAGGLSHVALKHQAPPSQEQITGEPIQEIPLGSNVYKTESGRIVIETPSDIGDKASQKTKLRDGLVIDKETGETLTQVEEGTVSAIQDAPKSDQVPDFPITEAGIDVDGLTTEQGKGPGLDRAVQFLVDEGLTLEDAQIVVRGQQEEGRATKDITESSETREKLLEVERAIEPDEQNPKNVEHKDKLNVPEFSEPGWAAILTNKRKVMDRIGAFRIKGFTELFVGFEKMQHLKGNLRKIVNKTIRALNKQATLGDKIARRIMNRSTKPVRHMVDLLDTYERLPAEIADKLSKTEIEAFNAMRDITKWLLERANIARKKAGLKPINDLKGYIPHWTKIITTEVLSGKHIYKSGYVAELMKGVPKVINNPTAYQRIFREINQKIQDHMESDLGKLMHGLINYDLHDIMLTNPLAETWEQLRELHDTRDLNGSRIISDRTYKYIADYLNYDILKKQTTADKIFNEAKAVKTVTQMINKVLKPINREISNPAASFFGGLRKVWHAAFMPFRVRNITRNFGQRLLNLSFHRYRDLGRAQFGEQDKITHPITGKKIKVLNYIREQDWYKITKPEDTLDDNTLLANLTQYGMIGFKTSHVGNRYASNVDVSALSGYYDWKHRFEQSHIMSSKHYKNIIKESKRTDIPIENLQTQKEDMMDDIRDAVTKTQWEYMTHTLPTIIRGQSGRALAAYQSWWMNYYTAFLAEGYHNLMTGRTRVRSNGTGGRLLTPGARYRIFKGMGGLYGVARIAQDVFGVAMLGALWLPDPTNGLPPFLSLVSIMIKLMTGFKKPEKRKQAWKDLEKTLKRMMPFSSAAREIARVGDDWTLKDYVFYTENEEWKQIWIPVKPK